jgi:hypothetical protein
VRAVDAHARHHKVLQPNTYSSHISHSCSGDILFTAVRLAVDITFLWLSFQNHINTKST